MLSNLLLKVHVLQFLQNALKTKFQYLKRQTLKIHYMVSNNKAMSYKKNYTNTEIIKNSKGRFINLSQFYFIKKENRVKAEHNLMNGLTRAVTMSISSAKIALNTFL